MAGVQQIKARLVNRKIKTVLSHYCCLLNTLTLWNVRW